MHKFWTVALALVAAVAFTPGARAQCGGCCGQQKAQCPGECAAGGKQVTQTGSILCAKCELNETPKCQTVIQVTQDGKKVTYYFKDKGARESYHRPVCGGGSKQGTVTGVVAVKDGKNWITPSKVEYAK
jgi:hypothetical protein